MKKSIPTSYNNKCENPFCLQKVFKQVPFKEFTVARDYIELCEACLWAFRSGRDHQARLND